MRRQADANGCRRWTATVRRLSKGHANDHAVTVQWMADDCRRHVKTKLSGPANGRASMQQTDRDPVISVPQRSSWEWAKLIRKLRWIRLEHDARRLEGARSTLQPGERGCVSAGPVSTDEGETVAISVDRRCPRVSRSPPAGAAMFKHGG